MFGTSVMLGSGFGGKPKKTSKAMTINKIAAKTPKTKPQPAVKQKKCGPAGCQQGAIKSMPSLGIVGPGVHSTPVVSKKGPAMKSKAKRK